MNKYMHTLDGKPAIYDMGEQVRFVGSGDKLENLFVDSLSDIKEQWKKSEAWRTENGFEPTYYRHSYLRFSAPTDIGQENE